jgi:ABC-type dipeptide/oligopeptide/nickel transport system ATPase component
MAALRAATDVGMIFQEPMTALNPLHTIAPPDDRGLLLASQNQPRESRRGAAKTAAADGSGRPVSTSFRAARSTRTSFPAASASA